MMDNETQRPTFPIGAFGMVPGGTAWEIPVPDGTDGDKGVNWKVNVPGGTPMLLFMTDAGRFGLGGSTGVYTVGDSLQQDCLSSGSHTTTDILEPSTSASPSPTSSSSSSPSPTPSSGAAGGTNVGAIVGAVVGSVGALALGFLVAFLYFRRKRQHQRTGGAVDLHDADDEHPMTDQGRQSAQMESLLGGGTAGSGHRNRHSRISSGFDSIEGTNNRQSMLTDSTDYPYPVVDPFPSSPSANNRHSMTTSNSSNRFMTEKQQMAHSEARRNNTGRSGARSPGSSYALSDMAYVDAGPAPDSLVQGLPPPTYDAVLRARNPDPEEGPSSAAGVPPSPSAASRTEPSPPTSPPQRYSSVVGPRPSLGERSTSDAT